MQYIISAAVLAVFVVFVFIAAVRTRKRQALRLELLTEEQKDFLKNAEYRSVDNSKKYAVAPAILTNIKDMSKEKTDVDFIFWNRSTNRLELGEHKMLVKTINERNTKVGDTIEIALTLKRGYIDGIMDIM